MPHIQVHSNGSLSHSQLIDGDGGIVCKFYPADDPACSPLEPADGGSNCPHLAEIQPHAAAEFGNLCEVIDAAVNTVKGVGNGVDKAGRKLMIGLTGIGKGRRRHRNLQTAEHQVKAAHPFHPIFLFMQGKV